MFWLDRVTGAAGLYLRWARAVSVAYHALAYHRGALGKIVRRLGLR